MFKKDICPCCLKPYNKRRHEQCPFCYGIDFDQIEEAYISFVEDRFHNEIEKTRTLVASYETGGTIHNHWEITPVIHHIYDGTFYTFYIKFKNGEKIKRILEKKNELCKRLCEIAKDLQAFDTEKRIQIANAFSDGFYMNVVEELALEYNNYEIENYFHEKMEEFIEVFSGGYESSNGYIKNEKDEILMVIE